MTDACLFDDLLAPTRDAPCPQCSARDDMPFSARFYEVDGPVAWWAAEMQNGPAIVFRVFPANPHGLPTTPEARFNAIRTDYANGRREVPHQYRRHPARAKLWATASINVAFRRFLAVGDVVRFRPARACEVMCWLVTHEPDLLAAENQEALLSELEKHLP